MMKNKILILATGISLLFAACSPGNKPAPVTSETIPMVTADSAIIAEGRLEPIHYAEIALTASGEISNTLVQEGQAVKKGDTLIHLGDELDTNYAAAQLDLLNETHPSMCWGMTAVVCFESEDQPSWVL
jgi:multidrug efflux pump subunit AcrA (membrane-fusion protein)